MLCKNPFVKGNQAFGCGQCLPCRINRRRLWTHRIMLESSKHENNTFVTLTYSPQHYPDGGSLEPRHPSDFLKRLRKAVHPIRLRYYLVGEYGDQTQRAHYHLAIFGIGPELQSVIESSWGLGMVHCGTVTKESAGYLAGYVTKKLTKSDDPRLNGRHPEFARMSFRPGIGAGAMDDLAELLTTQHGSKIVANAGDVPMSLQHGNKSLPLGRYLRKKLRENLGYELDQNQAKGLRQKTEEMQALFKARGATTPWTKKQAIISANRAKVRNMEVRHKIFSSKKEKL